jgi:hypothetical protein
VLGVACALAGNATALPFHGGREASKLPFVLRGVDSQNLPPFTLPADTSILWTCAGCGGQNFIVSTDNGGVVNALGPVRGSSFLPAGRYGSVNVIGTGAWTIRFTAATKRPVRSSYTLSGVDGSNVKPFTLTHGSRVTWSCPRCHGQNFIFSTGQGGVVNALGPTHGSSYMDRGRYTDVSVIASGPWTITIR